MRYKPKSIAALHIALGGLADKMRVEVDPNSGVSAKTIGELRKLKAWPDNLVITTAVSSRAPSPLTCRSCRRRSSSWSSITRRPDARPHRAADAARARRRGDRVKLVEDLR